MNKMIEEAPRINYIAQLNAFRDKKLNTPGLTAGMISVYYALLDMNNQSKWSEVFDVDFGYMCALSKVDKTTYYKALDFFLVNGLIINYTKGRNLYSRAKLTLVLLYEKSLGKQEGNTPSTIPSNTPSKGASDRNNSKTINNKKENQTVNDLFDEFWNLYDKKIGKENVLKKWNSLNESDQSKIIKVLPAYIKSTFEKKFRKNPLTYLNGGHWEDEIISDQKPILTVVANEGFKFGAKPAGQSNHK